VTTGIELGAEVSISYLYKGRESSMTIYSPSKMSAAAKIAMFENRQKDSGFRRRKTPIKASQTIRPALSCLSPNSKWSMHRKQLKHPQQPLLQTTQIRNDHLIYESTVPSTSTSPLRLTDSSANALEDSGCKPKCLSQALNRLSLTEQNDIVLKYQSSTPQQYSPLKMSPTFTKLATSRKPLLVDLENRLQSSQRHELVELLHAQQLEAHETQETLEVLKAKLRKIEIGLSEIELERETLAMKVNNVQVEKAALLHQLQECEDEIAALTNECALQADEINNTALLRSENNKLLRQVDELKKAATNNRECMATITGVDCMRRELAECRNERDELLQRLDRLKHNFQAVEDNLQTCLSTSQLLMDEKTEWEAERRRLVRRTELEKEQQRQQYVQSTTALREDLRSRNEKVHELEQSGHDKERSLKRLRDEMVELKRNQIKIDDLRDVLRKQQQEIQELTDGHAVNVEQLKLTYENELEVKEYTITALEGEVERTMNELMTVTSKVQKAEEDSAMLEGLTSDVEALQQDKEAYAEMILEKDTLIAELEADILKREIEDQFTTPTVQEFSHLQCQIETLKHEKNGLQIAAEKRLKQDASRIYELENGMDESSEKHDAYARLLRNKQSEITVQYDAKISALEAELAQRENELTLRESRAKQAELRMQIIDAECRALETSENDLRMQLHDQADGAASSLNSRVESFQQTMENEAAVHRKAVEAKDSAIVALKNELRLVRVSLAEMRQKHLDELARACNETKELSAVVTQRDDEIRDLRVCYIPDLEARKMELHMENARLLQRLETKSAEMKHEIDEYEGQVYKLKSKVTELESVASIRAQEHQQVNKEMTDTINNFELDTVQQQATIRSLQRRLLDADGDFATISQRLAVLEGSKSKIEKESQRLRELLLKETETNADLLISKEVDSVAREKANELARTAQAELARSLQQVADQQAAIASRDNQVGELKRELAKISQVLKDMALRNKLLESQLQNREWSREESERENNNLRQQVAEMGVELDDVCNEWKVRVDDSLEQLHAERHQREIAEADLIKVKASLECVLMEAKGTAELEKENRVLKDKVRRQEAYLKRKIEKDRASRALRHKQITTTARTFSTGIPLPRARSAISNQRSSQKQHQVSINESMFSLNSSTMDESLLTDGLELDMSLASLDLDKELEELLR
jgi:hypothetical protein